VDVIFFAFLWRQTIKFSVYLTKELNNFIMFGKKKKKTNNKALLLVATLSMSAALFILKEVRTPLLQPSPFFVVRPSQFAHLTIDFGDGVRREFKGEVVFPMSAFDALYSATISGELTLDYRYSPQGTMVERIGDKTTQEIGKAWHLYVNGERIKKSPTIYQINPQDFIEWKYEQ